MPQRTSLAADLRRDIDAIVSAARTPSGQVRVFKRAELEAWEAALGRLCLRVQDLEEAARADGRELPAASIHYIITGTSCPELRAARLDLLEREGRLAAQAAELRQREEDLERCEILALRKIEELQTREAELEMEREQLDAVRLHLGLPVEADDLVVPFERL